MYVYMYIPVHAINMYIFLPLAISNIFRLSAALN